MTEAIFDKERAGFFDNLADSWDSFEQPAGRQIEAFLDKVVLRPGHVVLDVGTGTGMLIPHIFRFDPARILALDLSARMLERVNAKYGAIYGGKLIMLQGDLHRLELEDGSVNAAICNGVYPHFYDKALALNRLFRLLKPGGVLAVNHFSGKGFVNSIHQSSANDRIRGDILEPVAELAEKAENTGFTVREAIDNEREYRLIAGKP